MLKKTKTLMERFYEVRKDILNNTVASYPSNEDNQDIDQFDHPNCHYLLAFSRKDVIGGVRLTPSLYPNSTFDFYKKHFPGAQIIQRESTLLEMSKFGVKPHAQSKHPYEITIQNIELIEAIFKFALDNGYKKVITVIDAKTERIFKALGVPIKRMSEFQTFKNQDLFIAIFDIKMDRYDSLMSYKKTLTLLS